MDEAISLVLEAFNPFAFTGKCLKERILRQKMLSDGPLIPCRRLIFSLAGLSSNDATVAPLGWPYPIMS